MTKILLTRRFATNVSGLATCLQDLVPLQAIPLQAAEQWSSITGREIFMP